MFSLWVSMEGMCLVFIDALRAYFHTKAKREVYVELSAEDYVEGMCGLLQRAMYGTRRGAELGG